MTTTTDLTSLFAQTEKQAEQEKLRKRFHKKRLYLKEQIKEAAALQKEEKKLLRQPHSQVEEAGILMSHVAQRASDITWLLINYALLRGKESSHGRRWSPTYGLTIKVSRELTRLDREEISG